MTLRIHRLENNEYWKDRSSPQTSDTISPIRGGHPETTVTEEFDSAGNLKTRTARTAASRAAWQAYARGYLNGGTRLTGPAAPSSSYPMSRLRRWTRWWGSMMSCGWHAWPARSS